MQTTDLVIEHEFDYKTLEDLRTLRSLRIQLVEEQLNSLDETMDKLVINGLLPVENKQTHLKELKEELIEKLNKLKQRSLEKNKFYFDEIELYVGLVNDHLN